MPKRNRNEFSESDISVLNASEHVTRVTRVTVSFTEEFREKFYQRMVAGETPEAIFMDCEIPPDILGISRIRGFANNLKKKFEKDGCFSDRRAFNHRPKREDGPDALPAEATSEQRMVHLENEVQYLKQSVEFLKKIREADLEAQKQWASQRQRTSSST